MQVGASLPVHPKINVTCYPQQPWADLTASTTKTLYASAKTPHTIIASGLRGFRSYQGYKVQVQLPVGIPKTPQCGLKKSDRVNPQKSATKPHDPCTIGLSGHNLLDFVTFFALLVFREFGGWSLENQKGYYTLEEGK